MDITIMCDNCGTTLDGDWSRHGSGIFKVAPCEKCVDSAVEDAVSEAVAEERSETERL